LTIIYSLGNRDVENMIAGVNLGNELSQLYGKKLKEYCGDLDN